MASIVYNRGKAEILKGNIPWLTAGLKALLVNGTYTPDPDHDFVSSASSAELSGTGYTSGFAGSGRQALVNPTVTERDSEDRAVASADPLTWTTINAGTIAGMIIYKPGTSDADSVMVAFIDVPDLATNGTDVQLGFPTVANGGILYI